MIIDISVDRSIDSPILYRSYGFLFCNFTELVDWFPMPWRPISTSPDVTEVLEKFVQHKGIGELLQRGKDLAQVKDGTGIPLNFT